MVQKADVDLVLVNPSGRKRIYQSLSNTMSAIETPVWAGLMATFARKHGFSAEIIDASAQDLGPEDVAAKLDELNPRMTAVVVYGHQPSASTQVMPGASAACNAIKERSPQRPVVLVGGHVAALPDITMRDEKADFVAGGEGLYTLIDLLEAQKANAKDLSKVRGLWHRADGKVVHNTPAPLVQDVNALMPTVAWDLLEMPRYRAHNWHCFGDLNRQPYAAIYTTLGCPYKCTFCCIQAPFKEGEKQSGMKEGSNSYRYWSVEGILKQFDELAAKGVRNIKIADEMFVLNPQHVLKICDGIIARGHKFNIWAYARVDTIQDRMLEKLKQAGFNWLAFGIEAASERVRDDVQKGFGQDEIFSTIAKVQNAGINVIGNYIFGLPEDDLKTMQATLDMAIDLNCEMANFYCTMAYPGSPLYTLAQQNGWALPQSWSGYSQHSVDMLPLPTKHLSAAEVIRFRDDAFQKYFLNPKYLDMVQRKFGAETRQHIVEMSAHKLERKFAR